MRLGLVGAAGRMGRAVVAACAQDSSLTIATRIELAKIETNLVTECKNQAHILRTQHT